jgi:hypothetical protein
VASYGKFLHGFGIGIAQAFDVIGQKRAAAMLHPNGEEIGGAGDVKVVNVCHAPKIGAAKLRKGS